MSDKVEAKKQITVDELEALLNQIALDKDGKNNKKLPEVLHKGKAEKKVKISAPPSKRVRKSTLKGG